MTDIESAKVIITALILLAVALWLIGKMPECASYNILTGEPVYTKAISGQCCRE